MDNSSVVRKRSGGPRRMARCGRARAFWRVVALGWVCAGYLAARGADLPPILEPLPELRVWDHEIEVKTGIGYKDNLLLSDLNREGSGFVVNGADISIWRIPVDANQFFFFVSGEDTRYFHGQSLGSEQLIVGAALYKRA